MKQTILALALALLMAMCASAMPVLNTEIPRPFQKGVPSPMLNPQAVEDCGKWFCFPPVSCASAPALAPLHQGTQPLGSIDGLMRLPAAACTMSHVYASRPPGHRPETSALMCCAPPPHRA